MTSRVDSYSRPVAHFTPASGWINDPLGITWQEGQYHLFFQYIPDALEWGPNCQWGHAVSDDLMTWRELEPVLAPGEGDDGVWSGSLVKDGAQAQIFYTSMENSSLGVGAVRSAVPRDQTWSTWDKNPATLVGAPESPRVSAFRDPFVFRDPQDGRWRMLMGASLPDDADPAVAGSADKAVAAVLGYVSDDLKSWSYDGIVASRPSAERDPIWTGSLWECPQLVRIDGIDVLIISVWDADVLNYVAYQFGEWRDGKFEGRGPWQRLTYGTLYATTTFVDNDKEVAFMHWLREYSGPNRAGALSVPHRISVVGDQLKVVPHPVLFENLPLVEVTGHVTVVENPSIIVIEEVGNEVTGEGWQVKTSDDAIELQTRDETLRMPHRGGRVEIVSDHGCLEVFGDDGVMAIAL